MSYRSFTVEAWIYPTTISSDNTIFSQCACTTCINQCLTLILRSGRLYLSFGLNDLQGSTTLTANAWYHVAFVYNYATAQQIIYLDGVQDGVRTSTQPYIGQSGSIIIGAQSTSYYYYGNIDNLALTTRAKSASEISDDATLMFYYSFDLPYPFYGNGLTFLNNTAYWSYFITYSNYLSVATTSGRVNQGIRTITTSAGFQMCCFYPMANFNNKPYTFAVWIYPTSIAGGSIVHVSYYHSNSGSGTNCYGHDVLALTSSGQILAQLYQSSSYPSYIGRRLSINTWTHVACTYSSSNGLILYVNGVQEGSVSASTYGYCGYPFFVTLGYSWNVAYGCSSGTSFQGSLDEFYTYRRELSATEILALASV
ncbi:unnamed protein product [Rotaria sordida]|uniref:LamG-like jellyroll fold domain-containing protein n=1 Tax=Rotaria sordida TaxID=392033 RepID=A0A819WZI3_9BILA|nr:unnamed protein product [Rotaria sordida]CAF4128739.1 unnamed protein product [Rotaria sordida]